MQGTEASLAASVVATLELVDRQILALRYAERLSVEEIALVLMCSPREVERRLATIRQRTREALAGWQRRSQVA